MTTQKSYQVAPTTTIAEPVRPQLSGLLPLGERLAAIGGPGSGKSTLLAWLFDLPPGPR